MNFRRGCLAVLVACALESASGHGAARAADRTPEAASLHGIVAVRVVVEQLGPAIEGKGITRRGLEADVESQLRQAGLVNVVADAPALLYANVSLVCNPTTCGYNIDLDLQQPVRLQREPHAGPMLATTWSTGTTGILDRLPAIRLRLRSLSWTNVASRHPHALRRARATALA